MAYPSRAHLLLLLLLLLPACLSFMSPHAVAALSFSYNFSKPGDLDRANLQLLNGNSSIARDRIDLTKMAYWSTGRVAYRQPLHLWDRRTGKTASFTTSFSFAIDYYSNSSSSTGRATRGDGMAFFIGPFPAELPPDSDGGFLGLFSNPNNTGSVSSSSSSSSSSPQTVSVEFDTNYNKDWDPPAGPGGELADHIGIDLNSISSTSYTMLPYGSLTGTMSADITYDGGSKLMVATLRLANGTTHSVQATVDFSAAGLPQDVAVGFSAATGAEVGSNQLLSWSLSSTDPSSKIQVWLIVLLCVLSASLAGFLVAALLWAVMRRRLPRPRQPIEIELPVARKFNYQELSVATNKFSADRKLGAGSFGEVFRGDLNDPGMPPVAVKRLTTMLEQTMKDYVAEIMTLGQLSHRNLVKLVGWCDGGGNDKLLLVYELVTNGSLDEHLHGPKALLPWSERYTIVMGIGSAIEYLHTGCKKTILHRDIKPNNVMLDGDFKAKLGDFGLVRQVDDEQRTLAGTVMIGTRVYMDPVCMTDGTVNTTSDMYSFGVLLLEIATGINPAEVQDARGLLSNTLVKAVQESYGRGAVLEMADARLKGDFDKSQMERVLLVGLMCLNQDRQKRPHIREAVYLLSNDRIPVPQVIVE